MSSAVENTGFNCHMPVVDHLEELRTRIVKSGIALILGMIISYLCLDQFMNFIMYPAGKLYYTKPAEAFYIYVKICLAGGCLIALPLVLYQAFAFVLPAFSLESKKLLFELVFASGILVFGGLSFAYFFVLPLGLKFFMGFSSQLVEPIISMESYLDFFFTLILPFGLIFNIPLFLVFLAKIGALDGAELKRKRKWVIFLSFLVAAILTPPDAVSQIMLALPILALYEGSILVITYLLKK